MAAAGVGRHDPAAHRAAPRRRVHPVQLRRCAWCSASSPRRSRCCSWPRSTGFRWAPPAHWSSSARSASRWRTARAGTASSGRAWLPSASYCYPAVGRRGRPGRRAVRARCGRLLGRLHPAHPARRRRGRRHQRARGLHARRRPGGHHHRRPAVFDRMTPEILLIGIGLAILLPVVPFALELLALRKLTTAAFGTLMSLEPAFAMIVGLIVLHQVPGPARRSRHLLRRGRRDRRGAHRRPIHAGARRSRLTRYRWRKVVDRDNTADAISTTEGSGMLRMSDSVSCAPSTPSPSRFSTHPCWGGSSAAAWSRSATSVVARARPFEMPVGYRRSGDDDHHRRARARCQDVVAQLPRRRRPDHAARARRQRSHRTRGRQPRRNRAVSRSPCAEASPSDIACAGTEFPPPAGSG